ncbi:MAG: tetratricopeptide repeat protein [Chitinophagales bacterium]
MVYILAIVPVTTLLVSLNDLVDHIYEEFNLPDTMPGYPPKEFRKLQSVKAQERVAQFIPVFEIGNFLNVLAGQAEENQKDRLLTSSQKCYHHLIDNKITTIEMYNNLGLNYLSKAIMHKEVDYALPMELDFYTRLYVESQSGNGQGWGSDEEEDGWGSVDEEWDDDRKGDGKSPPPPPPPPSPDLSEIIDEGWEAIYDLEDPFVESIEMARIYFEKCLALDRNYTAAYNNLAATNLLLEEYEEAYAKARKALRLAQKEQDVVTERNAVDLLVLTHFFMDESEECLEYLHLSKEMESPIYNVNYKFISQSIVIEDTTLAKSINGVTNATFQLYIMSDYDDREKINNEQLYDIAYELMFETDSIDQEIEIDNGTAEIISHKIDDQNFYIFNNIEEGTKYDRFAFYDVDETTQTKTQRGITIADSLQKVIDAYGQPIKVISGNRYNYWVYYNQNTIVKIKEDNTVGGWVFYDVGS